MTLQKENDSTIPYITDSLVLKIGQTLTKELISKKCNVRLFHNIWWHCQLRKPGKSQWFCFLQTQHNSFFPQKSWVGILSCSSVNLTNFAKFLDVNFSLSQNWRLGFFFNNLSSLLLCFTSDHQLFSFLFSSLGFHMVFNNSSVFMSMSNLI
jgi:hypothetical protein